MSRVTGAIASLKARIVTASSAVTQLSTVLELVEVLFLYRKYFPNDYAKEPICWSEPRTAVQACENFVGLASEKLFPCYVPWMDFDQLIEEGGANYIYLEAPWPGWWESEYRPVLSQVEYAILFVTGRVRQAGEGWECVDNFDAQIQVSDDKLKGLVASGSGPLRDLPVACDFYLKRTGNVWCDISQEELDECGNWPTWNEETVDYLVQQWAEAKKIFERVQRLEKWVCERSSRRKRVERILRDSLAGKSRVQAKAMPLIDQMTDYLPDGSGDEVY